jgi:hypothetical protein
MAMDLNVAVLSHVPSMNDEEFEPSIYSLEQIQIRFEFVIVT